VDDSVVRIECVDNPIISDTQSIAIAARKVVVRKCRQSGSDVIDFRFDAHAKVLRQFEKPAVETAVVNL
jgi:hypothetical protein